MRIRFPFQTGSTLGYSIERLSDSAFFDFNDSTFKINPTSLISALPEDTGSFVGRYRVNLTSTPVSQFTDGDYLVTIHNTLVSNKVVGELGVVMHSGNDATVIPGSGSGTDPWSMPLPGVYPAGTAGAILGNNLDAKMTSRSVYAGGPVSNVKAPVTVGSNSDKTGYILASSGFDAIQIESGVNARQALSPVLAASAGILLGAGTGTVSIKGGNVAVTRILASTDNAGNRTAVTLVLPP